MPTTARGVLVPSQLGEVDIFIEARQAPGSEPTSGRPGEAAQRLLEAFDRAQAAIVQLGRRVVASAQELQREAAAPESIEVQFGLSFTTSGKLVLVEASGEASLTVTLKYPGQKPAAGSPTSAPVGEQP